MLEIKKISLGEYGNWDKFLDSEAPYNLFSRSDWIIMMADVSGAEPIILIGEYEDKIIGGLAGVITRRFNVRIFEPPIFTPYNGMVIAHRDSIAIGKAEISNSIIKGAREHSDRLYISNFPRVNIANPEIKSGYISYPRYTSIIDLTSVERVKSRLKKDVRNKINKANKSDIIISEDFKQDVLLSLLKETLKRTNVRTSVSETALLRSLEYFHKRGWMSIYLASKGGKYGAGTAVLKFNGIAYSWLLATDPNYYRYGITPKLSFDVLLRLSEEGFNEFDFMGVNLPGVGRFKESFGGDRVGYYVQDIAFNAKAKLYRFLQRVKNR